MTLQDLRKLSIKQKLEIHFQLKNGQECLINRQGIAQVPGLKTVPAFNLEEELAAASEFLVETQPEPGKKGLPSRRKLNAAELSAMASAPTGAAAADHDDE
jgi:hypothetical protein